MRNSLLYEWFRTGTRFKQRQKATRKWLIAISSHILTRGKTNEASAMCDEVGFGVTGERTNVLRPFRTRLMIFEKKSY